jgi:hypothetical protein
MVSLLSVYANLKPEQKGVPHLSLCHFCHSCHFFIAGRQLFFFPNLESLPARPYPLVPRPFLCHWSPVTGH